MRAISLMVTPGHPLHENLETMLQKVPLELTDRMNKRQLPADAHTNTPSEKALVRLHKQVVIKNPKKRENDLVTVLFFLFKI